MAATGAALDTPPRTPYGTSECEHDLGQLQTPDPEDRPESDGFRGSDARCDAHRFSASDPDPIPIPASACNNSRSETIQEVCIGRSPATDRAD